MPAAIKYEILVFLLALFSVFVKVLPKLSLANGKLYLGFVSHPDPQNLGFFFNSKTFFLFPFIPRKREQSRFIL